MTIKLGYHASHEQFSPRELIDCVLAAEQAGFDCVMSSDHFAPWSHVQGHSGFAWSWLGAAMQATTLPFGVISVPGGWRYHPAILAQAAATLCDMFPGRLQWLALGSGERLNEGIVGRGWPDKDERNDRLLAGAQIIRALLAGERVSRTHPIAVEEAQLYTRPRDRLPLVAGALTPATAEWAGGWADGLVTVGGSRDQLQEIIEAFRRGGGAGKPIYLQVHLSYAETEEAARANAFQQWRCNAVDAEAAENLATPQAFEAHTAGIRPTDMDKYVRISSRPEQHIEWLLADAEMGFEAIYLHNVGRNQKAFIDAFGAEVLPDVISAVAVAS